jgi:hypothetical protein
MIASTMRCPNVAVQTSDRARGSDRAKRDPPMGRRLLRHRKRNGRSWTTGLFKHRRPMSSPKKKTEAENIPRVWPTTLSCSRTCICIPAPTVLTALTALTRYFPIHLNLSIDRALLLRLQDAPTVTSRRLPFARHNSDLALHWPSDNGFPRKYSDDGDKLLSILSPSLEYDQKLWWDQLLDTYSHSREQSYVS